MLRFSTKQVRIPVEAICFHFIHILMILLQKNLIMLVSNICEIIIDFNWLF